MIQFAPMVHAKLLAGGTVLALCAFASVTEPPAQPTARGEIVCKPAPAYQDEGRPCSAAADCHAPASVCQVAICDPLTGCTTTPQVGFAQPCGVDERCIWGMCCHDE